jgi:hypothetical protein
MTCRMAFGSAGKPEDLRLLKSICQDFDEKSLDIRKSIPGKAYQEYQHGTANILTDFFNLGERNMPPFIPSGSTIELELAHLLRIIGNKVIHIKNAQDSWLKWNKAGLRDSSAACRL